MSARKSGFPWFWLLVVAAAAGGAWWWFGHKPKEEGAEYRTAPVTRGEIVQIVTASGQLGPLVKVQIGSQVSGNIREIHVDYNSKVTNGQLVAELDPATYRARLVQAEGELANVKAQCTLAELNARRAADLRKDKLISDAEYDQTMAELEQRRAIVRMREASLDSAKVDFERTRIFSPIDGTVISRSVDVGQTVQASFTAPTLFVIAKDLTKMQIEAMVSEADVGGVEVGQDVTFTVDAFPNRTFAGRVSQVRNEAVTTQNVVTYATIIEVGNDDLKLKPGMTANVGITVARKDNVLRVANAALRFHPPDNATIRSNAAATAEAATPATGGPPRMAGAPSAGSGERRRPEGMAGGDGEGRRSWGGRGARAASGAGDRPAIRTAYLVVTNSLAGKDVVELVPSMVKCGIGDNMNTEIVEGLAEGDNVAIGTANGASASTLARPPGMTSSPFGGGRRPF